jgi:Ca2+-binding RTX toxin-like protein
LRSDLAQHPNACTLAYMHDSRFTSGDPGNRLQLQPFWQALHEAGAEIVLGGGSHMYERFAPQTARGAADPAFGIRQFIVGTGGHSLAGVRQVKRNSELREPRSFGVLILALHPSGYDWSFKPDGSSAFSDSGTGSCHGSRPAPTPKPKKGRCTLTGTPGDDILLGTPGKDLICGLDGADTIDGGAGNDVILGGEGRDRILGQEGRDRLYGGTGDDVIIGAGNGDVILAGGGNDRVSGGRGRDRLLGGDGDDILRGGAGNDVILGDRGRDSIRAGAGRDTAYGNAGDDVIRGQRGADRLLGNGGRNRLLGGAGNDRLVSFVSRHAGDRLNGGSGRDRAVMDRRDRARSVEHVTRLH